MLRPLGPTVGGLVGRGVRWQAMLFGFGFVCPAGGEPALRTRNRRRLEPRARLASKRLDRLDDEPPGSDDWPHTTRMLPWASAAFVVMLFLVPFDAIDLPVSLPLSSTPDRPLLIALVTAVAAAAW